MLDSFVWQRGEGGICIGLGYPSQSFVTWNESDPQIDAQNNGQHQFQASGGNALTPSDEPTREKLKRFVAYRQDLERVRNLCYMISRREKFKKSMVKYREQILEKQLSLVSDGNNVQHM